MPGDPKFINGLPGQSKLHNYFPQELLSVFIMIRYLVHGKEDSMGLLKLGDEV